MANDTTVDLKEIPGDDLDDILMQVERSFDFKFGQYELKDVMSFEDLCDVITNKINAVDSDDCTTQQAFYKLREAIVLILSVDKNSIKTDTELRLLFPRKTRRKQIARLNELLGFNTNILSASAWVTLPFLIVFLVSIFGVFWNWQIFLPALIGSCIAINLASKFGKELIVQKIGELTQKIAREHYIKSRRDSATINKKEIAQKVKDIFDEAMCVGV